MAQPPHTCAAMRALYPVCQVAELTAGYRDTTNCLAYRGKRNGSMVNGRDPSMSGSLSTISVAEVRCAMAGSCDMAFPSPMHGPSASLTVVHPVIPDDGPIHRLASCAVVSACALS